MGGAGRGRRYRWLVLVACLVLVGVAVTLYTLPEIVRRLAIARIEALTGRAAAIERVDLNLFTGRFTIRGFRLAEREGEAPFADFQQLDLRLNLPSLLVGHLWIRELALSDSPSASCAFRRTSSTCPISCAARIRPRAAPST